MVFFPIMNLLRLFNFVGTTFAVAFMIMLIAAAIALALGNEDIANRFAEIGYYFLVVAVVANIVVVAKESSDEKS